MKKLHWIHLNPRKGWSLFILAIVLLAYLLRSCTELKRNEPLTIGEGGNLHQIVIPDNSDQVVKFAASELQSYLKKITGKELPVVKSGDTKKHEPAIRLILDRNKGLNGMAMKS